MTDNPFDLFDDEPRPAPVMPSPVVGANPFDAYDEDEEAEAEAAASRTEAPPPALQPLPAAPGISFTEDDPGLNEALTKLDTQNKRAGTDALNEASGKSFIERILSAEAEILRPLLPGQPLSQHHAELVKGVPSGAVSSAGTALQGVGGIAAAGEANAAAFGRGQLEVFDRIDRGEAVAEMDDPVGYQHMTPEQRQQARADVERAAASFTPTPAAQQPLYRAGETVKAFAKTILPAAPGYEQAFSRQVSEGLGSMAIGLPVALVGGGAAAGVLYGAMGSGEATERAVEFDRREKAAGRPGLTADDITRAALWGVAPGVTDTLPVEMLLGRLRMPQPFAHWVAKGIARTGGEAFWRVGQQALVEGGQEGFQTFLQNVIASEYRADQRLAEDILPSSGIGAGVGGLAQSAQEIARLWIAAAAGRRARNAPFPGDKIAADDAAKDAADATTAPEVPAAPGAAVAVSEDAGERGVDVIQFIRNAGGLKPAGELDAVDAKRYPGLVNARGLSADKMRERMVEAGYLAEAGPDAPAVTTPQDVYDTLARAIGGERIVPIADREAAAAYEATQSARDEAREYEAGEQQFTIPEITRYDEDFGEPVLLQAYRRLDEASRREVIDRNRRGEDVADLLEEMAIRYEDAPALAAMVVRRGIPADHVATVREIVARERPELAADFEAIVEQAPQRPGPAQQADAPKSGEMSGGEFSALQATAGILPDAPARQASPGIDRPSENLADLIAKFNKSLNLVVRQGRINPGLALSAARAGGQVRGQASRVSGVIRLRVMQEFDTLAHEGGHALEIRFKRPLEAIKQRHAAELTPLASPGPDAVSEGFAEWFRRFVTNPVASKRVAPNFEADFEAFLATNDAAMLASLREIRDGYQAWLKAPSGGVVAGSLATTVKPGTVAEVTREIKDRGFRNTIKGWVDKLYTTVIDDLHPINLAVRDLLKIAQANLPAGDQIGLIAANDAYKLLRLGRDAYAGGHMDLLYGVAPYRSTQAQGPSFRDALAKAFGGLARGRWNQKASTDFGAYLISRRMVQEWIRFEAGELSNPPDKFSRADHEQSIADFEKAYPQFRDAAAMVHTFLGNMLRKKLDAGLITPELYADLIARKDYVPALRDMTDRGGEVEGRAPARKDKQSIIKRFKGSQRDVINPLESIAKDAYETAAIIARNDAVKALDALARAAGPDGGRFAERIPAHEMKASQVNLQEAIKSAADAAGVAPGDLQIMIQAVDDKLGDNAIAQVWRAGEISEKGEPIIYLWEAGKRIPIRLADGQFGHDMLHAITGLNRESSGWLVNFLSLPATAVRMGVTASMDFIIANYLRDQASAWVLTRDFVPFYDGAKGVYSDLTMQEVSRIYSRAGGIFGGANTTSLNEARIKREVLQLRKRGIRLTLNPFTRDFWRMTEFSETGTRIAVFKKAFDRAKTDGLSEYEAALEAAFAARDYIDFGRRGSRMLAARRLIPFFNAALQGIDRTVRGLRGKVDEHRVIRTAISPYIKSRTGQPLSVVERRNLGRASKVWAHMVVLGMFGLAQSMLYRDDEEYEEISDYIRNTHWLFKLDGEWIRIPKPFELAIFSNIFERTFEYAAKDDPKAPERMVDGLFQLVTPPHSIPGLDIGVQLATNKREITVVEGVASLLPGRKLPSDQPIIGRDLEGLPPELRFNQYASEFGKYLGGAINTSPAVIDHMVTGFGASWGREFLNATNQALPALGRATDGAFKLPTNHAAETAISDYFLLRRFMKDATRGAVSNREFWDLVGQDNGTFTQAANGYKLLVDKIRDAKGAQEFLDSLPEDERAYALLEAGNSGSRAKLHNLHPLNRAKEIVGVTNGVRKAITLHRLYAGEGDDEVPVTLSPTQMRVANDVLADISMREARNALVALGAEGWKQKAVMPVEALWSELAAVAPEVHEIALDRLKTKKLPSFEDVRTGWPAARKRLLEEGQDALLHDLYAREVPAWGRRDYQPETRP